MHLLEARLCLDCEELHTSDTCPRCASDAFAFLTRWVPANERRVRGRRPAARPPANANNRARLVGGAAGIAAFAAIRWLFSTKPPTTAGSESGSDSSAR